MSDVSVGQASGWIGRLVAWRRVRRRAWAEKVVEDTERFFERKAALDAQTEQFNNTPPKVLLEKALAAAGLPADITQVQGRVCVYSIPEEATGKTCLSSRIVGITLRYGRLVLTLENGQDGYPDVWYSDGSWSMWFRSGDSRVVHDFSLV